MKLKRLAYYLILLFVVAPFAAFCTVISMSPGPWLEFESEWESFWDNKDMFS